MHADLILTLTGGLAAALVCGYLAMRVGLSPIVGYLLAGFLVGPNTPGFVADRAIADQFAAVGIILLMFGVGLQFHLEELLAVRQVAVPGALVGFATSVVLGTFVGLGAGWGFEAGIVFGLSISVASTVVLLRVLADAGDLHTRAGHVAVGWLVVEDVIAVVVLVVLPAVFGGEGQAVRAVLFAVVKVAVLVELTLHGGGRVIPWILTRAAATRSRELFTLTVLVLALGIAVGSARGFGVSMALGAFLAGMVVGRSEFSLRAATEALPMRDAFAVLFFVSVGMLFDARVLVRSPGPVVGALAVILVGKPMVALIVVRALGQTSRTSATVAAALGQIGEFSFILAAAGRSLGILHEAQVNTIVAAAIASITISPIVYRLNRRLEGWTRRIAGEPPSPGGGLVAIATDDANDRDRVLIVGCGPVGRTLVRLLVEHRYEPVVIELNLDTVRQLAFEGIAAVYGDVGRRETLEHAGVVGAVALVFTASHLAGMPEAIRMARDLNPRGLIAARGDYLAELPGLRAAGADVVFSGEAEVALSMTEALLRRLGATVDQIDRERDRLRAELFGRDDDPSGMSR